QKRADLPSFLDELRTRVVARAREIDVDGCTNSPRPWRHHDHAVRHQDGFLDAVRNHQHRLLRCLADPHELTLDALPALLVEGAEWLVEQHDVWIGRECAAHCNALAHAARELLGKGVLESGEPDKVDQLLDLAIALRLGHVAGLQPELDIAAHRHPREQRVLLEHDSSVAPRPRDLAPSDKHLTPRRAYEPGDD